MEYFIFFGSIVVVLVTGLIRIRRYANSYIHNHNYVHEFREKFVQFTNSYLQQPRGFSSEQPVIDHQLHYWLIGNMDKVQRLLGIYGRGLYTAPFNRFQIPNYEYIINTINQMSTGDADHQDLSMCDNMMVRYLGAMSCLIDEEEKEFKNPITWLQHGIQFYLGFPLRLLAWFGIISDGLFHRIVSSKLFQVLAGIGGFIGFLASLVTILEGWETVRDFLKGLP